MATRKQAVQRKLQAYYDFFAHPVGWQVRVLLLVSLAILPFAWRGPLWTMSFQSNQYPDPLKLAIHIDHLDGQKTENRDDLREINSLNHYIGMRPLLESDFSEFLWLPFVVGIFFLLTLRVIALGRLRDLVDVTVLYGYFGLFSLWTFYSKLYRYGHELAPDAAIKVEPFTPPLYGKVKIANFWVESYPGTAAFALTAFAVALGLAVLIAVWQTWRDHRQALHTTSTGGAPSPAVLTLFVGLVAVAALSPSRAAAAVLPVGPGQTYASVAEALIAAQPGDELQLAAGSYPGNLVIDKPLRLTASGRVEIIGDGTGNALSIQAPDVEIAGLTISGSGHNMMHSHAGIRVHGDDVVIRNCTLEGNLFGIYLDRSKRVHIEGCTIRGPAKAGLGSRGAGIHLYDSHECHIEGNDVAEVRDGVYFDHANGNLVEGNVFARLRYGVHYMYCEANEFYRNTFRDSMAGVAIMYTDGVKFSDNQILNNRWGHNAFGLLLQACKNCTAERNVIVNNTCGFFLEGARDNLFRDNLVAYNDVGAVVFGSSSGNTFARNDFVENLATLHCIGKPQLSWSAEGGNYYSDYEGYDLDADGIGDLPHKLQSNFEFLTGNHPLLQLYLSSAAADALTLAERSFPLLPQSAQYDERPQMRPVASARLILAEGDALLAHGSRFGSWVAGAGWCLALLLMWRLAR